jgi:N-acetylglutamate synthase-like GNAT family acetyltransferase
MGQIASFIKDPGGCEARYCAPNDGLTNPKALCWWNTLLQMLAASKHLIAILKLRGPFAGTSLSYLSNLLQLLHKRGAPNAEDLPKMGYYPGRAGWSQYANALKEYVFAVLFQHSNLSNGGHHCSGEAFQTVLNLFDAHCPEAKALFLGLMSQTRQCPNQTPIESRAYDPGFTCAMNTEIDPISLQDLLNKNLIRHQFTSELACLLCKQKCDHKLQQTLAIPPRLMMVSTSRVAFLADKSNKKTTTPLLNLWEPIKICNTVGRVIAVSIHHGESNESGHYTGAVKSTTHNVVQHYNDDRVSVMDPREIQAMSGQVIQVLIEFDDYVTPLITSQSIPNSLSITTSTPSSSSSSASTSLSSSSSSTTTSMTISKPDSTSRVMPSQNLSHSASTVPSLSSGSITSALPSNANTVLTSTTATSGISGTRTESESYNSVISSVQAGKGYLTFVDTPADVDMTSTDLNHKNETTESNSSVLISKLRHKDVDEVLRLYTLLPLKYSTFSETFIKTLQTTTGGKITSAIVIKKGKELLGYLHYQRSGRLRIIHQLVIDTPWRRHGLATQLIQHFLQDTSVKRVEVKVYQEDVETRTLFTQSGFESLSRDIKVTWITMRWTSSSIRSPNSTHTSLHFTNDGVGSLSKEVIGGSIQNLLRFAGASSSFLQSAGASSSLLRNGEGCVANTNVRSLRNALKKNSQIFFENPRVHIDLLVMTEVQAPFNKLEKSERFKKAVAQYPIAFWNSCKNPARSSGYAGVALLCHIMPLFVLFDFVDEMESEGRLITSVFEDVIAIGVYSPASRSDIDPVRTEFDHKLALHVTMLRNTY